MQHCFRSSRIHGAVALPSQTSMKQTAARVLLLTPCSTFTLCLPCHPQAKINRKLTIVEAFLAHRRVPGVLAKKVGQWALPWDPGVGVGLGMVGLV